MAVCKVLYGSFVFALVMVKNRASSPCQRMSVVRDWDYALHFIISRKHETALAVQQLLPSWKQLYSLLLAKYLDYSVHVYRNLGSFQNLNSHHCQTREWMREVCCSSHLLLLPLASRRGCRPHYAALLFSECFLSPPVWSEWCESPRLLAGHTGAWHNQYWPNSYRETVYTAMLRQCKYYTTKLQVPTIQFHAVVLYWTIEYNMGLGWRDKGTKGQLVFKKQN